MEKKNRVLVTGATGYIGSHTIVELVQAGFDVVGTDNFYNSDRSVLDGIRNILGREIPFVEADCSDKADFARVFQAYPDIAGAIHFAAYKAVGESVEKPVPYYRNNLFSLVNLMELMQEQGDASIVFSSSATVYGQPAPEHLPVKETAPVQPATSPYGRTKQMAEEMLRDAAAADSRLRVTALRYFNPIGAHPSALIGELPRGVPQNLVPYIVQTASGLRKELSIFGNDYHTPDGTCIRDYIYVCDLARAHVAAVRRMFGKCAENRFEVFNLGTGRGLSVLELVNAFMEVTGVQVPYRFAPRRAGDIEQVWADPSLANEVLGWKADTPIADVLASAWKWECHLRKA